VPDTSTAGPSANATSVTLYIGGVARLDGSTSTGSGLGYAWTIKTVPAGSTIATASLATANTAVTTFTPDKLGIYELELTVTAGTQASKATATATVVDPPIFYYDSDEDAGTFGARLFVTGATASDGGKPVACFERDSGAYTTFARRTATAGTDWWEAPAGQPSKIAFIMEATVDGGQAATLFATTSTGSCAAAPTKLDFIAPPANGNQHAFEQPRISPDGTRVAYARQTADGAQIATVGLDGMTLRTLGSRNADNDGGALPEAGLDGFPQSRPFWIGNTQVGWIETIAADAWQIARANDAASATREIIARCTGSPPTQAASLPNGEILVSQFSNSSGVQLIAYPIVAATKTCGTPRVLTPAPDGGTTATDFALSPDGKEVAYLTFEGSLAETRIVKVDGTSAPRKVGTFDGAQRGPRWVAAGSFVSFANDGPSLDAGWEAGVIAVVPADGGGVAVAATGTTVQAIGNGNFNCSMGNVAGSGVAFAGVAGVAMLRLLRRRRRR
jgi:MYXO-CTERM domain-containing protein